MVTYADIVSAVRAAARRTVTVPLTIGKFSYQVTSSKRGPTWEAEVQSSTGAVVWRIPLLVEPPA